MTTWTVHKADGSLDEDGGVFTSFTYACDLAHMIGGSVMQHEWEEVESFKVAAYSRVGSRSVD